MSTVKANTIEPASGGTITITGAALTTPALGTPASGTLTNCTGLPASTGLSGTTLASNVVNASLNAITPTGGTLAIVGAVSFEGNQLNFEPGSGVNAELINRVGAGFQIYVDNATKLAMTLDTSGNNTVTGTSTAAQFQATGGTPAFSTSNQGTNGARGQFVNSGGTFNFGIDNSSGGLSGPYEINYYYTGNYDQVWSINSAEKLRLKTSGELLVRNAASRGGGLAVAGKVTFQGNQLNFEPGAGINAELINRVGAGFDIYVDSASKLAVTINSSGNVLAGTSSGNHHIFEKASSNDYSHSVINSSATSPYGQCILLNGVTGGTGVKFLSCQDNAERFAVRGNGNVENVNNSYGALSDAKLKRDVTDTGPKLSKVLAMRIVNYYLKADQSNTKLLGMIAQELREISPGLVEETPDFEDVVVEPARTDHIPRQRQKTEARTVTQWQVEVRDGVAVRTSAEVTEQVPLFVDLPLVGEDGQPIMEGGQQVVHRQPVMEDYTETVDVPAKIERRATGTVTLSVKYSILVPMLVKAMQELHADFDTRLKALEARA